MKSRQGFTIIELLVVISILGLLASMALPRLSYLKQKAQVTSMVSDLRNLLTSQEAFISSHGDYAGGVVPTAEVPGTGGAGRVSLQISEGVVLNVTYQSNPSDGEGWSATAQHPGVVNPDTDECGVFIGHASFSPNVAVTAPGVITCY
jgi:prepilin-type N-terminal cleavage/methylation domain-containing protein